MTTALLLAVLFHLCLISSSRKAGRINRQLRGCGHKHHTNSPYSAGRLSQAIERSVLDHLDSEGFVEWHNNLHGVGRARQGDVRWSGER